MSRLFVTGREMDLIQHWTKEIIADVIGETVYYFAISREKSDVHDVYDEAIKKIFENPIKLDALVAWDPSAVVATEFGTEQGRTIKVYLQSRDLINKEISVSEGDFISYGDQFFEIVSAITMRNVFGQVEYTDGIELVCEEARASQFVTKVLGPTSEAYADDDAIRKTFVQQRGFENNSEGPTGDKRDIIERGVLDLPISEPREVSPRGDDKQTHSFYDED